MTDTDNNTGIDLIKEIEALRKRVAELETLESINKQHLHDLAEKEAFNFALFQSGARNTRCRFHLPPIGVYSDLPKLSFPKLARLL